MGDKKKFMLGLCQILVGTDKAANLSLAREAISKAVKLGAQIVSLPECFNSPYNTGQFREYSEIIPKSLEDCTAEENPSTHFILSTAKEHGIYLIGGSIPEKVEQDAQTSKIYNTCVIASPTGELIGKHRKMHLFDIDVPGGITFKESDTLTGGSSMTVFDTEWCKVGVAICYDIRFPELAQLMRAEGCELLVYPGAFNLTTGPPHWELLQRSRALDQQCYVATASPARADAAVGVYQAWGHSSVIDPWGTVVATTEHDPDVIVQEVDLEKVKTVRQSIPVSQQQRTDLYNLVSLK